MLYSAVAAEGVLVGAGVEEPDVLDVFGTVAFGIVGGVDLREEDGVQMRVGIVVIVAVAGETAHEDALVGFVSVVDGQDDELLVDGPGVG